MQNPFSNKFLLDGGREIMFSHLGDKSGIPILYIHGFPGSRYDIKAFFDTETLESRGLQVISFDRPGLGASDIKTNRDVHDFSIEVVQLMDSLSIDKFHVIANSSGSLYAYELSHAITDRLLSIDVIAGFSPSEKDLPKPYKKGFAVDGLMSRITIVKMKLKLMNKPAQYFTKQIPFMIDKETFASEEMLTDLSRAHVVGFGNDMPGVIREFKIITTYSGIKPEELSSHFEFWYSENDKMINLDKMRESLSVLKSHNINVVDARSHVHTTIVALEPILNKILKKG